MTIIPADGIVIIDGEMRGPLALDLPSNIHAVQWMENRGEIEFVSDENGMRPPNEVFTDIERFRSAIDAWSAWTPASPPQPPGNNVPVEVTNLQARMVMMQTPGRTNGMSLFEEVDAALRATGGTAWMAWEYANTISRNSQLVQQLATQFGLSDRQLDEMFIRAAQITV
jgi:hypothetical protein